MTDLDSGTLLGTLYSYQDSAILMASNELGIYDTLAEGPLTGPEVATRLGTAPRSTVLLLNACVALGLLQKTGAQYANSPMAEKLLVRGRPGYLGRVVAKEQQFYQPWGGVSEAVREDKAQLPSMEESLRRDPATARNFLLALHDLALLNGSALPEYVDLTGRHKLLDVGGGVGSFSILLAQKNPELHAVVLDLPPVAELAEETIASHGLSDRISFQAGDYRAGSLGERYDVVLLSNILHDNSEESCQQLLAKAHRALTDGGLVVVNEFFLDEEGSSPPVGAIFSVLMMLENHGATEYPAEQIKSWLLEARFRDPVVHRLPEPSPMVVVVAHKD
ncbi:MAG TPA: methyltransferase [Anaerolineae bacterium]|nr:methyltransferase [Anaerolineae bacterium]